ncbi:MAG: AAA family ATPase [Lachnospiraceae bacterium]|nr:AAA family ATPase [Lachnospiraceae bacterium]
MALRLWPKDFERKEHITKEEKALLRNAAQNLSDGHFAIGIDPVGMSSAKVHMGFYISPDKGLLTFSIYTNKLEPTLKDAYSNYVLMVEEKIYKRLLDSKVLIVRDGDNKVLKFPYKHAIIFANEKPMSLRGECDGLKDLVPFVYMQFLSPLGQNKSILRRGELDIAKSSRKPYASEFKKLSEQECRAIFERIAPEYTVIMNEKEHVEVIQAKAIPSEQDFKITGKELEYKTFFLDEYQVAQVNDMGKGHRVLLANPGAGKSVLLLSKAFKYASLYKGSKVLLTCFNSNLADSYVFKKSCANFGNNGNLYIMTLHKLVKRLFEDCIHKRCDSNIATPEEIQECLNRVRSGEIKVRFKAIFIDEVQIFEPIYLELCYALLEKSENAVFLMAGDLNQTVRSQSRRGDAPWKKINGVTLDFTGRVKYIEKNYRNSKQIGAFLNRMLCYMNKHMEKMNMISMKEFAYDSFELGNHDGVALKIQTGIERTKIQVSVLAAIKEIVSKYHVGYSDIAVLFPFKDNKSLNYHFMYWLTSAMDKEDISYSLITQPIDGGQSKVRYSKTNGVVVSTIDSSLGLDFKAVIVAGLYPYNYFFTDKGEKVQIASWEKIGKLGQHEREKVQIQIRKIYTACSRARDILYVLSDLRTNSPMEEILTKAKEK